MKILKQTLVLVFLAFMNQHCSLAQTQNTIKPIPGYAEVLNKRFNSGSWFNNHERNLDNLLKVVLSKGNVYNEIVPLRFISANDTTIVFYYSKELKKMNKKTPIHFTNHKPISSSSFKIMRERELILKSSIVRYDSIFQWMKSNMAINSSLFDLDAFLNSNVSSVCCRPNGYDESLIMIYSFFVNGILLAEEGHSGKLVCLPY
jgi:hypothetical protein